MRGGSAKLGCALAIAASALAGGCGDDAPEELASFAPPDAPLYAEAVVKPEGDQADAIESFADRIGGVGDPGAAVIAQLDARLGDAIPGVDYSEDIEPWLGANAAFFVSSFEAKAATSGSPDAAAIVEVDDAGAARDFIHKGFGEGAEPEQRTYEGVDYSFDPDSDAAVGVIDDQVLVGGTESAFKVAVDASQGESLAESEEYDDRTAALPDDPLGSVFLEPAATIEAAIASEGLDPDQAEMLGPLLGGPLSQPVAAALTATEDAASLDVAAMVDGNGASSTPSSLLPGLPGASWFAIAAPDLGPMLAMVQDQLASSGLPGAGEIERQVRAATGIDLGRDVLGWLGDAAGFVVGAGAPAFSAGVIAETDDPQAPEAMLEALRRIAERESGLSSGGPPEGAERGFSIGVPGVGGGVEAGVVGDQVVAVIGATVEQVLKPDHALSDNPEFETAIAALGDDLAPALYVDLPSFIDVAEQGSDGGVDYDAVRPYVDAFASLVAGFRVEDGLALGRATVTLAPR